jgi:hypothetical protein
VLGRELLKAHGEEVGGVEDWKNGRLVGALSTEGGGEACVAALRLKGFFASEIFDLNQRFSSSRSRPDRRHRMGSWLN